MIKPITGLHGQHGVKFFPPAFEIERFGDFSLTLNDSQKDDNNKEEKTNVKQNSVNFRIVPVSRFNYITNATSSPYTLVQIEHKTLKIEKK